MKELPLYKSHKKVRALEIKEVDGNDLTFVEDGYPLQSLPSEMFARYVPKAGDFLVVYEDGYKSFSPRAAFLEGYSAVPPMKEKPTIAELEKILAEDDSPVHINPDGSVERSR